MSQEQYLTFQKFSDPALASELTELLKENSIDFLVDDTNFFDLTFSNSEEHKEYSVKLKKENFEKAYALLLQVSAKQLDSVDKDYYLFDFTDEELNEIVTRPDEWNQFDYLLAQRILKERGKEITPFVAEAMKEERLHELAKPAESQWIWINVGYAFILFCAVVSLLTGWHLMLHKETLLDEAGTFSGGLISTFIGWHLRSYKKTLPNGDRVYAYSTTDRKHGARILVLGTIFFAFWIAVRIITLYTISKN